MAEMRQEGLVGMVKVLYFIPGMMGQSREMTHSNHF